jgi:hypothetical protein
MSVNKNVTVPEGTPTTIILPPMFPARPET